MQLVANIAHVSLGAELDTPPLLRTSTPALKAASVALPQRKRKLTGTETLLYSVQGCIIS
jgi:hypothetical protein